MISPQYIPVIGAVILAVFIAASAFYNIGFVRGYKKACDYATKKAIKMMDEMHAQHMRDLHDQHDHAMQLIRRP